MLAHPTRPSGCFKSYDEVHQMGPGNGSSVSRLCDGMPCRAPMASLKPFADMRLWSQGSTVHVK